MADIFRTFFLNQREAKAWNLKTEEPHVAVLTRLETNSFFIMSW